MSPSVSKSSSIEVSQSWSTPSHTSVAPGKMVLLFGPQSLQSRKVSKSVSVSLAGTRPSQSLSTPSHSSVAPGKVEASVSSQSVFELHDVRLMSLKPSPSASQTTTARLSPASLVSSSESVWRTVTSSPGATVGPVAVSV